jgi:AraC-like DNA-binding protein
MRLAIDPAEFCGVSTAAKIASRESSISSMGKRQHFSFDPERPDFAPYGLTCVRWEPSPMRRPDHHNEIELNFLESGTVTYLLGGRKLMVQAGQLTAFWAAIPHQIIEFGSEPSYYVATIPLAWFLQWRLPERFVQTLLQGHIVQDTAGGRSVADAQLFANWEEDLMVRREEAAEAVLLEMHARLIRMARAVPPERAVAKTRDGMATLTDAGLSKVERMACFVAQHYRDHIGIREIAKVAGLHPNYAMSLFQKTFGTTLVSYLTQHRVSHAQRLLATSNMTIADVAFSSGFNSLSRFNEAFRRICGCAPREYRRSNFLSGNVSRAKGWG